MRVLLVDDNEWLVDAMAGLLGRGECEVSTATSIDSALSLIEATGFDVVVCDLNMGEARDGGWLLTKVAESLPNAGRILLTGLPGPQAEAAAAVVLHKPASIEELTAALRVPPPPPGQTFVGIFVVACTYCDVRRYWTWDGPVAPVESNQRVSHGCCADCIPKHDQVWGRRRNPTHAS